jgi:hypothetical protein
MRRGIRAKFQQNSEIRHKLLDTGLMLLAECAPRDMVWGIGLGIDDDRIYDTSKWKGKNLLGQTLMQVRSDLRLWNIDENDYVEARDLESNTIWKMPLREVIMLPIINEAVSPYLNIVKYECGTEILNDIMNMNLANIEEMMRTNMGVDFPYLDSMKPSRKYMI